MFDASTIAQIGHRPKAIRLLHWLASRFQAANDTQAKPQRTYRLQNAAGLYENRILIYKKWLLLGLDSGFA
jgi:hypothetical protein